MPRPDVPATAGAPPSVVDPRAYRDVLGRFATGVTVVTTVGPEVAPDGSGTGRRRLRPASADTPLEGAGPAVSREGPALHPWGTTVNAFCAVSLDPPIVLACVGRGRSIHPVIARTPRFAVNVLAEDSQGLSDCFAGAPSPLPRSALCNAAYHAGVTGVPILEAAIAHLECELERAIDVGDHTMYLGRVVAVGAGREALPLLYFRRRYLRIEHAAESDLLGIPDV
jgi:flavin reductase (DIM6/NTAB) family NADH-FMN oxidoreductase RutF